MTATVDEVRKALEEIRREATDCAIERAFVKEGLRVCDEHAEARAEYEEALKDRDDDGYRVYMRGVVVRGEHEVALLASILRTAGRL